MKNPLVLFVGAAVVAVAALAGATADRWRDWPSPVQPTATSPDAVSIEAAEPAGEPESKLPPPGPETAEQAPEPRREQPAETAAGPAPREPDEQLAAVGADEIESPEVIEPADESDEAPVEEPERLAAVDAGQPQAAAPAAPSPPAAPDAEPDASVQPSFDVVRLAEDGSLIVAGLAAPGANVTLLLDGEAIASDAANDVGAWLLMPEGRLPPGSHQLMVQARDRDSGAETSGTIAVAVPERAADRPRAAHSEPAQPPAGEEQVALAPVQEPDAETEESETEPEEHAAVAPGAAVELEVGPEIGLERRDIPLALETVDYNDGGEIVFSGRADPGNIVRIHVDNRFVGETTADADGRWAFAGGNLIAAGRHTLRADLVGRDGNVVGRILLPFVRAGGREVAALVEARRGAVGQGEPEVAPEVVAPGPAEAEAEPQTSAQTEEAAPEPEPEAPVVVEEIAPEPEPEAPVVAEEVGPEPEPGAPVVAVEVAPEPEPEAPVVAEEIAPEPEPEPEPERPVVADGIAPEPEPVPTDQAPEPDAVDQVAAAEPETAERGERDAAETGEPEAAAARPGHVVIQPGNNLWRISRVIYGRGIEYTAIYEANRDKIRDPDLIYPGQIFATPGVDPPKEIDPEWREPLSPEDLARQDAAE